MSILALLSNYDQVNCLINVGTEGTPYRRRTFEATSVNRRLSPM
jgi:hypothetical protein